MGLLLCECPRPGQVLIALMSGIRGITAPQADRQPDVEPAVRPGTAIARPSP
jgi:hypothetical protein